MHNIDRTVGESNYEFNNESYEFNNEFGYENEFLNELNETAGEFSGEFSGEMYGEYSNEASYETNELSGEALEMELATELLGVSNEAELEQFLGSLIKKAAGAVSNFARSSTGRAIGGFLKSAAKTALPIVGRAAGTFFGGPVGAAIGGQLGDAASNLFELELEGLSNEDKEFELSRAYVRFAKAAVQNAARNPRSAGNPRDVARTAVIASARRYAPGLLRKRRGRRPSGAGRSNWGNTGNSGYNDFYDGQNNNDSMQQQGGATGTWYREGNQIILNL
ncbi:MAG: hypothetical protein IPP72_17250 [Chitinophagaceae bacterium]|nr:hypothetical protein [Chitinophagaceae bacterium]